MRGVGACANKRGWQRMTSGAGSLARLQSELRQFERDPPPGLVLVCRVLRLCVCVYSFVDLIWNGLAAFVPSLPSS